MLSKIFLHMLLATEICRGSTSARKREKLERVTPESAFRLLAGETRKAWDPLGGGAVVAKLLGDRGEIGRENLKMVRTVC
ncbi:hypothetical protein CDAR_24991 [Caerostris darwini]|uniref:Uncharacterized protein n=1 Tax=Caerostris darwini TaxID=1538125 RepID=A0AAV4VR36_9ARAC|nr:hypothetical protein CDAR_24991 [Caerostris darwini]